MLTDLLTNQNQSPTPLRKPEFNINLSRGDNGSGGLGGLASAVSDLVGGNAPDPWQDYTQNIRVECGCAPFVDQASIRVAPGAESPEVVMDDEASVELGYSDTGTNAVFSGQASVFKERPDGERRISFGNAAQTLAQQRVNMTFQQTTAADMVQQLISAEGIDAGNIANGSAKIPAYIADDRCSIYQHIARLANWSGHIAYINAENQLNWVAASSSQAVQTFVYGDDLISIEKKAQSACATSRRWQGEGAAGNNGSNAWNWLSKKAKSIGSGGEPTESRINFQGAFRDRETVEHAETGFTTLPQCQPMRFHLLASGAATVTIGSTVAISGTPQGKLDIEGVVIHLTHSLNKVQGFTTQIELVTVASQGTSAVSLGGVL